MIRGPYLSTVGRQWVDDVGFRPATRRKYLTTVEAMDRRIRSRRPAARFNDVTADEVRDFVVTRDDGQARADESRKAIMNITWALWDWACSPEIGLGGSNPVGRLRAQARRQSWPAQPVRGKTWLGEARAKLFVATTRGDASDPDRVRDAVIIALFLYTGLRLAELHRLRWRDVDLGAGLLNIIGKGSKPAQVPLNPAAKRLLFEWRSQYVAGYGSADIGTLAVVPRMATGILGRPGAETGPRYRRILWGRPIARPTSIYRIVTERAREAGLGHVATHDLRRSFAGIMKDRGATLEEISKALRHNSLETTRIYLEDKPELAVGLEDYDLG